MGYDIFNPTAEHLALRQSLRVFAEHEVAPQALSHDRGESFNRLLFSAAGRLGILGVAVPARFGGAGMDTTAAVIVHEELAAADSGFALSCLAHAILFANNLARNGDDAQREHFLPAVCSGERVAGMALSETASGTDALAMTTRAWRDGDRYILSGHKMWITNGQLGEGQLGDLFLVYARTGAAGPRGVSLFVVEKGTPGFSAGQLIHGKLGVRSSVTAELVFDECEVPATNRVGEEGMAVFEMMGTFDMERLTMAAMGLGIARRCLEIMNQHASGRTAFGKPIRSFGQIQRHIAESYAEWMAGRASVYQIAATTALDRSTRSPAADGAKLFCATMAKNVADRAIQVLGGCGYVAEYVVERLWRDAKLLEIGGGTLEAHQRNITQQLRGVSRFH